MSRHNLYLGRNIVISCIHRYIRYTFDTFNLMNSINNHYVT